MSAIDTAAIVVHQLFAALWAGSVVLVAVGVLPLARDGKLGPDPLRAILGTLLTVTRVSALLLLASGAHLLYWGLLDGELAADALTAGVRGYLVVAMIVLWLLLAAIVEVASYRLRGGLAEAQLREPAAAALPWFRAAAVVAVLALLIGGLSAAGVGA